MRAIATLLFSGRCRLSRDEIDFQVFGQSWTSRSLLEIANTSGMEKKNIIYHLIRGIKIK